MTPERWKRVKGVFAQVHAAPPDERQHALLSACGGDADLLAEVRSLLAADERSGVLDHLNRALVSPLRTRLTSDLGQAEQIGPYQVLHEVGRGGMGVVFRAYDPRLQRDVAIKLLPGLTRAPQASERLLQEARAASALDHPNICTIYDIGTATDGQLYLALAYYDGRTLKEKLEEGPLDVRTSIDICRQILEGLRCAHAAGIVHRDVKPANIMVSASGTVKILDFGIAKLKSASDLTPPGAHIGTLAYAAPEQLEGDAIDARADLWSVGVTLFEMLAGRRPFDHSQEKALVYSILRSDPPSLSSLRPGLPPSTEQVVMKALSRELSDRYENADAFLADLARIADEREAPSGAPVLHSTSMLPLPLTSLIGRSTEVKRAAALLAQTRLLTLTGPAGIGKTRLAVELARHVAARFEGGPHWIGLSSTTDPEEVVGEIARALAVPESGEGTLLSDVENAIAARPMLLVLDNFEHVIEAAPVVGRLLTACPALRVLVTSRAPLALGGEQEFPVPSLERPSRDEATVQVLRRCHAVQLFVERARAVRPEFDLNADNAAAVAELCRRLDGLPLALELAAARTKLLSPAALLVRLSGRLDLLKDAQRDRPSRHRTLQGAIAWSYDLLDEPARRGFRALSVFAGGFAIEMAEELLARSGITSPIDVLVHLLDHSLLQRRDGRCTMLQTLRSFARERLEAAGDATQIRRHHAEIFAELAERLEPALTGPEQADTLERLDAAHDDLRDALAFADEHEEARLGLRLGAALWRYWLTRGRLSEGRRWLTAALTHDDAGASDEARARALHGIGTIAHNQGDNEQARVYLEEGLHIWRRVNDPSGAASALNNLAWVACETSDLDRARMLADEALTICRELGEKRGMALALNNLGWIANYRGEARDAQSFHEQSLALRREIGDRRGEAFALANVAMALRTAGDPDGADQRLDEAEHLLANVGDPVLASWCRLMRARVAYDRRDVQLARGILEASVSDWRELGNRSILAWGLTALAEAACACGDVQESETHLQEALAIWRAIDCTWGEAFTLHGLAWAAGFAGRLDEARSHIDRSLALRRALRDRRGEAECLETIYILDASRDAAAEGALARAAELRKAAGAPVAPQRRLELVRLQASVDLDNQGRDGRTTSRPNPAQF